MKKKLFLLPCIAAVAIATFVGAKSFQTNAYESNDLLLQNVEALSAGSDAGCPHNNANHVPNRFLYATTTTETATCKVDGSITVSDGNSYSGSYKKDKSYVVIITTKNCDGVQTGACCDQRKVGTTVKKK